MLNLFSELPNSSTALKNAEIFKSENIYVCNPIKPILVLLRLYFMRIPSVYQSFFISIGLNFSVNIKELLVNLTDYY